MLEFEREELSLQWVAYSEVTPFKSYWIEDGAWTYLYTVQGDRAGATISNSKTYYTLEDAMLAAQKEDEANKKKEAA